MGDDLRKRLAAVPALGVLAGLAAGIYCAVTAVDAGCPDVWIWLVFAVMILPPVWLLWRRNPWVLTVFFFGMGIAVAMLNMPRKLPTAIDGTKGTLTGYVRKVTETDATVRYVLTDCAFDGKALHGVNVNVTVNGQEYLWQKGSVLSATGYLRSLRTDTDIPFEPDYGAYARVDGVTARMVVQTPDIRRIGDVSSALDRMGAKGKRAMRNAIIDAGFSEPTTAFALAIVAGDDSLLGTMTRDRFRTAGLAHVLALSGLHVGILVFLAAMLFYGLRCLPGGRVWYYGLIALTVAAYAVMTGLSPSVARASAMTGVFCLARITGRRNSPYNALFASVALWLLINPLWLWSPGLQLSAAAVLAILWLGRKLVVPFAPVTTGGKLLRAIVALVVVPVAALTGTSMLTILYFHALPLWFIPVNVVASLTVPLLIVCIVVCSAAAAAGIPVTMGVYVTDAIYNLLDGCVTWFASLPSAQITGLYADGWQVALYIAFICLIFVAIEWRRVPAAVAAACVLAVLVTSFATASAPAGTEVYIPAAYKHTDILVRNGSEALLLSNGDEDAERMMRQRCAEWLERRGCGEMKRENLPGRVTFGNRTLVITDTHKPSGYDGRADYMLVTGNFYGDVVEAAKLANADTVLLAAAIHPTRRKKFAARLGEADVPVYDLSAKGFAFSDIP